MDISEKIIQKIIGDKKIKKDCKSKNYELNDIGRMPIEQKV